MESSEGNQSIEPPAGRPPPSSRARGTTWRAGERAPYLVLLAIAGFFLARIPAIPRRIFDADEFEHAHAAWCVFRGMVPYRDFFEHHTPWYYYFLRPFFNWFAVDASFDSARHFLSFGRGLSFVLTLVSVVIVCRIGRLWEDRRAGLVAGLLLVAQPVFLQKTLEIRPDMLALPFFLAGIWFLLRGLARDEEARTGALRHFFAGGLSFGAAIMCTQKMLFVLPGAFAALGVWALDGIRMERAGALRSRVVPIGALLAGIGVPCVLTWAAFARHHAGGQFIANNFLLNAKWNHTPTGQLRRLVDTSWPVLALALLGVLLSLRDFLRSGRRQYEEFLPACIAVGLFAGVLVIPVAQRQYYLMPMPMACLFAAKGLFVLAAWVGARVPRGVRTCLFILAPIGLAVLPVLDLVDTFTSPNDVQLAKLRQVFERTKPTDVVMDGWEGMGVFRPHAFYFFFLHDESILMVPRPQMESYVDDLEHGRIRPKLIAMDEHLAALGPRFLKFVERNYVSRDGFFYFSKETFQN